MALQRRTGRRVKDIQFGTFADAIGEINGGPEVWFPFEEASGSLSNTGGSDAVTFTLSNNDAGPVEYAQTGPSGAGSAVTIGARGNHLSTLDELSDINTGSPSATGTMLFVFRDNWVVGANSEMFHNGGLNQDNIRLFFQDDGRMVFYTNESPGTAAQYVYNATFTQADMAAHSSAARNGDWHLFAVVQTATEKLFYLDGTAITPSTETVGASTDKLYWVHDSTAGSLTFGTNPTLANAWYWFGHLDEFAYWDGYEITANEVSTLWGHISPNAGLGVAREGMLYVLNDLESGLPSHVYDQKADQTAHLADRGSAVTKTTAATFKSTPTTLRAPGITGDGTSFELTATSYTSGTQIRHSRPDAADMASDASGYILMHWKPAPDAETNSWTPAILSIETDEDTASEPGNLRVHCLQDGRILFQLRDDDNTSYDINSTVIITGSHPTDDEVWQQLLIFQPADGNGLRMLHNGTFYDYDDFQSQQTGDGGDGLNAWIASAADQWSGASRLGIGGLVNTGASAVNSMEGHHGLMCIGNKSDWSVAEMARLFAASGITAA